MTAVKVNKLQYLEGLRGICDLLVIFHHFRLFFNRSIYHFSVPWLDDTSNPYSLILFHGEYQVSLFFFLSGRVLTLSLLSKTDDKICWKSIAASIFKRTLRLGLPLFGISLLTSFVGYLGLFEKMVEVRSSEVWFHAPKLFESFKEFSVYVFAWFTATPSLVSGHFGKYICAETAWTLPTELTGSFYIFLVTPVIMNIKSMFLKHSFYTLSAFILYIIHSNNLLFHLGLWIAELSLTNLFRIQPRTIINTRFIIKSFFLWILRLILVYITFSFLPENSIYKEFVNAHWTNSFIHSQGVVAHQYSHSNADNISALALLILFETTPPLQRLFSTMVFRFLGKISFALYLSHGIILMGVVPRWIVWMQPEEHSSLDVQEYLIYTALVGFIVLSIVLAWGCQVVFDAPAISFSRKVQMFVFSTEMEGVWVEKCAVAEGLWRRIRRGGLYVKVKDVEMANAA